LAEDVFITVGVEVGLIVAVGGTTDTGAVDGIPEEESEIECILFVINTVYIYIYNIDTI
jgi:hypothetical protein